MATFCKVLLTRLTVRSLCIISIVILVTFKSGFKGRILF